MLLSSMKFPTAAMNYSIFDNAPFTDITALSYSALSQLNWFGILANRPQTYITAPHIEVRKLCRRRMEKRASA